MTDIPLPHSITDPYAPEKSETKSVVCLLRHFDGTHDLVVTDRRACDRHAILRHAGRFYEHRGDDELKLDGTRPRWTRLYREIKIIDL